MLGQLEGSGCLALTKIEQIVLFKQRKKQFIVLKVGMAEEMEVSLSCPAVSTTPAGTAIRSAYRLGLYQSNRQVSSGRVWYPLKTPFAVACSSCVGQSQ